MSSKIQYQKITHKLPLFHQPWWLDAVCVGEWGVVFLIDDSEIVAVWPFQLEKKWGFNLIRNPLLTAYLGPISIQPNTALTKEMVCGLLSQIPSNHFFQWSCYPKIEIQQLLAASPFTISQKRTYILDLKLDEEKLWSNIHPKKRNDIRKAELDLRVAEEELNIDLFLEWHKAAFKKKGTNYPYSRDFFTKVFNASKQNNASVSYSTIDNSENTLAQIWLLKDETTLYYLLSAAPQKTHRGAVSLLIWKAILQAKKQGLTFFDFEGSMDKGIEHFFQKFGGSKEVYFDVENTSSILWKLKRKILG